MKAFLTKISVLESDPARRYGSLDMTRSECLDHLRSGEIGESRPALLVELKDGRVVVYQIASGSYRVASWPAKLLPGRYDEIHVTLELLLDYLEANSNVTPLTLFTVDLESESATRKVTVRASDYEAACDDVLRAFREGELRTGWTVEPNAKLVIRSIKG